MPECRKCWFIYCFYSSSFTLKLKADYTDHTGKINNSPYKEIFNIHSADQYNMRIWMSNVLNLRLPKPKWVKLIRHVTKFGYN